MRNARYLMLGLPAYLPPVHLITRLLVSLACALALFCALFFALLSGLTASTTASPVRVKGHAGQVLAIAFAEPFNVLITSGEKDRTVRCVRRYGTPAT